MLFARRSHVKVHHEGVHVRGNPHGRKRKRTASPACSKAGSVAGPGKEADADAVPEPQLPQTPDPVASPKSPLTAGLAQPPKRRMMPRLRTTTS